MPHAVSLISTLAAGFGLALLFGFVAARLGLPALIGYLVAGIVIGPATPGFVADAEIAAQLAEIGVMLLMFGVGLHFSLDDLLAVRKVALPGAVVQMGVATALGGGVALFWGWTPGAALVFGLTLSVASTVVLLKALEGRGELESGDGRIAIGWLVVEDLAMVLVLVVLPPLAGALGGTTPAGGGSDTRLDAGEDVRRGRGVRGPDAAGRPTRLPLGALAGDEDRLARAVHARRGRCRGDDRLRLLAAVRRVVRPRRLLRRHGAARVELQPSRRRGNAAVARCLRGAVLRLRRHAPRSRGAVRGAAAGAGGRGDHRRRQVGGGGGAGAGLRLSAAHRPHGLGGPGADRRVLVHPRRPRRVARLAVGRRTQPGRRRRADLDRPEPALLSFQRADRPLARQPALLGRPARPRARPARRAADVDRHQVPVEAGRARRLRPGRQAHRRRADGRRHPVRRRRGEPRGRRAVARSAAFRRCSAMRPKRQC